MRWWQIRKRDADVERELQSDLELEEEEQREHGVPPEEARHAALRSFGNPTLIGANSRCLELEQAGEPSSRSKDQRSHSLPVAWVFNHCRSRNGVVHRRYDIAIHRGAFGPA